MLRELELCQQNSKTELPKELQDEFLRVFDGIDAPCMEWAFREWRLFSRFAPAISDIAELVERWRAARRQELAEKERLEEKARTDAAQARGELVAFPAILRQLTEQIGKMPEPPHLQRLHLLRSREVNRAAPAIPFTAEQIAARRDREREEIRRAAQAQEETG